jgi:hypothetical protein
MQSEIKTSQQLKLHQSLQNSEANTRLRKFFEVLIQINKREKLVKNEHSDHKRNTNNSSKG